jgi:predicted phosphoribosyltransferase
MTILFRDRHEAGAHLASMLPSYAARPGVVVLGLARGGVPVAAEVARVLGAPLDVFIVRKIGVPGHPEYAVGAIASGGTRVLDDAVIRRHGITAPDLAAAQAVAERELALREQTLRGDRPPVDTHGSIVILVDDGMATGSTMRAAVEAVRTHRPVRIVVAVPVAAPDACAVIRTIADECHCLSCPPSLRSVGEWYADFSPTEDQDVRSQLEQAMRTLPEDLRQSVQQAHASLRLEQHTAHDAHR